ncbi:hypothetical protein BKA93DRAFT_773497 [Sparassis latifolia]
MAKEREPAQDSATRARCKGIPCSQIPFPDEDEVQRSNTDAAEGDSADKSAGHEVADVLEEGQDVSWTWGGGTATGKVAAVVEEGSARVTSDKGNTAIRHAREGDPAVEITRDGNDVVKLAHELDEVEDAAE